MASVHVLELHGHRLELTADRVGKKTRLRLTVDGREVLDRSADPLRTVVPLFELDGLAPILAELELAEARLIVLVLRTGRPRAVRLVNGSPDAWHDRTERPESLPFEPPPGTRAYRVHQFWARHPNLYAARHVAVAVVQVAVLLLGVTVCIKLIPWGAIPWPDWDVPKPDLPNLPLPNIPFPDIDPEWEPPGWIKAFFAAKIYWMPILLATLVAVGEADRRKKRRAKDAEQTEHPTDGSGT